MPSKSFAPFRQRAFLLVWLGAMVSNIGTWMETTALSYYVADHSRASWSGVVAAAGFLPTALLSPVGGAWADRFRRRNVMIWTNSASAVIAASIALIVATGDATPGVLALMSLAAGCANAIGFPSFQATLPDLVPREDLVAAIGLSSTQWNLGRILGPTAAGVAIWLGGVPAALWCNAASFFAVILAISFAKIPLTPRTKRPILQALRDSIHFGRTSPAVRSMLPVMFMIALIGAPFIGFIAQMATKVFHTEQSGTSLLVTAQGVGAVIAGASMGALTQRFGMRRTMIGAVTFFGPAVAFYGFAPNIVVAAIAVALAGGGYMACISSFSSITQQSAPAELRGRAMTLNNFVLGFAYPLGLFIEGPLADATSLRAVTVGSGLLTLGILVVGRLLKPRHTEPIALALS
ncbi:MAG: arabinose efflux permease family protein [Ilumatobacteraceae bacterium]|nr:arabinose efflux permease family protein [Ilumatobacteraceae bacterium]